MVNVTWNDAAAYCKWVGGRLPTEAEWEYAARGGLSEKPFPWGNDAPTLKPGSPNGARFTPFGQPLWALRRTEWTPGTVPVACFGANGFGLYDMAGNVWEWCSDWFAPYQARPLTDPKGPPSGTLRVARGGGWRDSAALIRVTERATWLPDKRPPGGFGLRCARDLEQ
jgi:formylglycine-generating enzyme required for sulfatase activity